MTYPRIRSVQSLDCDCNWAGPTAILTAGENLAFGDAIYIGSDSKMWKAKADAPATMPCTALAAGTISANDTGEFLLSQFLRNDAWSWILGGPLYVSATTAGALTQTKPEGAGAQVQVVGKAIAANIIYFSPEAILVGGGGGGDMLKSTYDPNEDGIVKDSDKLEGSTKAQVQDHAPKAHTLGSHSTKAHSELTGVTASQHHAKTTAAGEIVSGRFPMTRMPDMALNKIMVGQGPGNSPVEEDKPSGGGGYTEGARVYNDANIAIPHDVYVALTFNSQRYDTDGIHSLVSNTSRLTCKTAGIYIISFCAEFNPELGGGRKAWIYLNGANDLVIALLDMDVEGYWCAPQTTIWDMAVDDYVEVIVHWYKPSAPPTLDIGHFDYHSPEFMMQRIG